MLVESLQWCDRSYLARNGNALEQKWLWDFNAYSYESLALLPNPIPCVSLWAKQTRAPMRQNTQGCICWHPASWKLRAQRAGSDDVWWPFKICNRRVTTAMAIFYLRLKACKQQGFWTWLDPSVTLVTMPPDRPCYFVLFCFGTALTTVFILPMCL